MPRIGVGDAEIKIDEKVPVRQTKDFLNWVLLVKTGHSLAFYRPNFRLQT